MSHELHIRKYMLGSTVQVKQRYLLGIQNLAKGSLSVNEKKMTISQEKQS